MNTYTLVAYILRDGAHYVEEVAATNATEAALALRTRLDLTKEDFEIVAIINGHVTYAPFDERQLALAPYSPASP